MPPKNKNHLSYFTTMTFGVERRISQLLNYIRSLDVATVGEMQERMLMDFNRNLIEAMDNCQLAWLDRRDEIHPISTEKIRKLVDSTVHMGEAALRKAERFIAQHCGIAPTQKPPNTPMDKPDRLDNTLKPDGCLKRSMTLEEARTWLRKFDKWFEWNAPILAKKDAEMQKAILENYLDDRMLSRMKTDATIKPDTPIRGPDGLLKKLELYYTDDTPMIIRRHNFISCMQERGENFLTFWERKMQRGQECSQDTMTPKDWLQQELVRCVHDNELQRKLLQEIDPTLEGLIKIATLYQNADSAQVVMKREPMEEIRRTTDQEPPNQNQNPSDDEDRRSDRTYDHEAKRISDYKKENRSRWNNQQSNNRPPSTRQGPPSQCSGCGAHGDRMHLRDHCPARNITCFQCGRTGHFRSVCRSSQRQQNPPRYNDARQPYYPPQPSYPPPSYSVSQKMVRVNEVREGQQPDPTPMMENIIVIPHEGGQPFEYIACPDTGCTKTIIARNLAIRKGMRFNPDSNLKIRAVNAQRLDNSGSVTFTLKYQGRTTEINALVSDAIKDEILLSWRVLKNLGVIDSTFPNVRHAPIRAAKTTTENNFTHIETDAEAKHELTNLMGIYKQVFQIDGRLRTMKGEPMQIHMKKNANITVMNVCTPRKTPLAYLEAAKKKIDEDVKLGIIEKVEGVSEWCSPMSFVQKPNGGIRSVVDLVHLNKFVDRPTHPFPAAKEIVSRIPKQSGYFAVFDCKHGYWQIELAEESRPYTCFMTEWGRYQYRRAPMGLISSGDEFCARSDRALADIPGVFKLVDDILVHGKDYAELLERIKTVFARCEEYGITLSKDKYQFGPTVKFAGYIINQDGSKMNPDLVAAISKFPAPKDITNLRSLIGLVNRFNDQNPDLKHAMAPWQLLLKKSNKFIWDEVHEQALNKVKEIITNPAGPILRPFDSKLPTRLLTDASRSGIGFCLVQEDTNTGKKTPLLIQAGSRFLNQAEKNYAVIELELLAIQWATEKSRLFLAGTDFTIVTDHQPLLGVLNRKNLDAINNVRIQRLMSKLLGYSFKVEWIPGKNHSIADALSRNPVFAAPKHKDIIVSKISIDIEDLALEELSRIASEDKDYQEVVKTVLSREYDGKLIRNLNKHHPAHQYSAQWEAISVHGVFLTFHGRMIVPAAARKKVLANLHLQHTGRTKTLADARQLYFWPGMTNHIELMIANCRECIAALPSQTLEPQIPTEATRPFEHISIDLGYQKGNNYLIGMDRYSGWPMVAPIPRKANTTTITNILDDWFVDHGLPISIRSDGGPQFRGPFDEWCRQNNIRHELSSAYHHESNGHAECAVREVKKLLAKTSTHKQFQQALRNYRNCPRYDGLSPAQWYLGRRQRTEAVAFPSAYARIPDQTFADHEAQRRKKTEKLRIHANRPSRPKPNLHVGQPVIAQHVLTKRWDQRGMITEDRDSGRSYLVQINGRKYLRNRRFLRPLPRQSPAMNIQPPGNYHARVRNREFVRNQPPTPSRPRTHTMEDRGITRRPQPNEQDNNTPTRHYPLRARQQRIPYQAAIPQPKRRNRPPMN